MSVRLSVSSPTVSDCPNNWRPRDTNSDQEKTTSKLQRLPPPTPHQTSRNASDLHLRPRDVVPLPHLLLLLLDYHIIYQHTPARGNNTLTEIQI